MTRWALFPPFGDLISSLIAEFTTGGMAHLRGSRLLAEAKEVIRYRVLREVRFNIGVLTELADNPALAVSALDYTALKQLHGQPFDLALFFPHVLPVSATSGLLNSRKKSLLTRSTLDALASEAALIELLSCKLAVATARLEQSVSAMEVGLLALLFGAVGHSLEYAHIPA